MGQAGDPALSNIVWINYYFLLIYTEDIWGLSVVFMVRRTSVDNEAAL
jgi:hypothetical protein